MVCSEIVKEASAYARWFRDGAFEPWRGLEIGRDSSRFHPELGGPIGQVSTLGTEPHELAGYTRLALAVQ